MEDDTLLFGSVHFPGMGGHLVATLEAGEVDFTAQTHCRARHVNGHVAAPEHQHTVTERGRIIRTIAVLT